MLVKEFVKVVLTWCTVYINGTSNINMIGIYCINISLTLLFIDEISRLQRTNISDHTFVFKSRHRK